MRRMPLRIKINMCIKVLVVESVNSSYLGIKIVTCRLVLVVNFLILVFDVVMVMPVALSWLILTINLPHFCGFLILVLF